MVQNARLLPHYQPLSGGGGTHEQVAGTPRMPVGGAATVPAAAAGTGRFRERGGRGPWDADGGQRTGVRAGVWFWQM